MQQSPEVMNDLLHVPPPGALQTTGSFNQELWGFPKCLSRYSSTLLLLLPAHWAAFAPCAWNTSLCCGSSQGGYEREVEGKFCCSQSSRESSCCSLLNDTVNSPALTAPCSRAALKSAQMGKYFPLCHLLQLEEDFSSSKSHQVTEPCTAAAPGRWHCTLWGRTACAGQG